MILDERPWPLDEAWRRVRQEHDDFLIYGHQKSLREDGMLLCGRWARPPDGYVKLNVDGSHIEGEVHIGGGGVIRNSQGQWELAFSSCDEGDNAFQAELGSLRDGLRLAWNAGFRRIVAEVDCAEVLAVLGEIEMDRFCPAVEVVRELLRRSWEVNLRRIPRECNCVADWYAKFGARSNSPGLQVWDAPCFEVQPLLFSDNLVE